MRWLQPENEALAMHERNWWSQHIKWRWHQPLLHQIAWKVEDAYNGGKPDVDFVFKGVSGKIELKYIDAWPAKEDKLITFSRDSKLDQNKVISPGQYNHLEQWAQGEGLSLVFIGVGKESFLFPFSVFTTGLNDGMLKKDFYYWQVLHGTTYNDISYVPQFIIENYGRR